MYREDDYLSSGSLLKANIHPGEGDACPREGDLVRVFQLLVDPTPTTHSITACLL